MHCAFVFVLYVKFHLFFFLAIVTMCTSIVEDYVVVIAARDGCSFGTGVVRTTAQILTPKTKKLFLHLGKLGKLK